MLFPSLSFSIVASKPDSDLKLQRHAKLVLSPANDIVGHGGDWTIDAPFRRGIAKRRDTCRERARIPSVVRRRVKERRISIQVARVIKRQSSGLNRENDAAALFDETCPSLSFLFPWNGNSFVSRIDVQSLWRRLSWNLSERCSLLCREPGISPIDARCIRPRTNRRSSRISKNEHALPPRGNYNFFLFPRQERKEYYHQSLDRAFQIAHDASYNFAITRTLLNCLCLWISCLKNNLLPSLPISRLYLMEFTRCTALLEANFIHFTSIPNNPA